MMKRDSASQTNTAVKGFDMFSLTCKTNYVFEAGLPSIEGLISKLGSVPRKAVATTPSSSSRAQRWTTSSTLRVSGQPPFQVKTMCLKDLGLRTLATISKFLTEGTTGIEMHAAEDWPRSPNS